VVHVYRPTANKSKLIDLATNIGYDVFTYGRWRHRLAWMLPLLKCVSQLKIAEKSIKTPTFAFKVIQGHWSRRQSRASVRLLISD